MKWGVFREVLLSFLSLCPLYFIPFFRKQILAVFGLWLHCYFWKNEEIHCILPTLTSFASVFFFFVLFGFLFVFFRVAPAAYGGSQVRSWIKAVAAGLYHSHSNARSLTHWVRPGMESESSWMLVGFVNSWATTGTLRNSSFCFFLIYYSWFTIFSQFLLYSKAAQSYIYIHSFSHIIFHQGPSRETA